MPKFASKTASKQKEQELATKLNQLVTFFHGEVLHGFIPLTVVRTVLLLILLVMGYSTTRASTLSGFCPATVRKKKSMLERGLLNKIFSRKSGSGRKSRLASTQDEIIDELESHDYSSAKQIRAMIQEKTAVNAFLHKLGFKWLKCGSVPSKADPEAQRKLLSRNVH